MNYEQFQRGYNLPDNMTDMLRNAIKSNIEPLAISRNFFTKTGKKPLNGVKSRLLRVLSGVKWGKIAQKSSDMNKL